MADSETRRSNLRAIQETVNWFSPGGDWRGLHAIAKRESGLDHYIAARSQADRGGARRAWDARMRAKLEAAGNPYTGPAYQHEETGGWFNSHGLFQMMAPYHVPGWSWTAPPIALNHPVVATVVAARLWNRGARAGARNLCDLRSFWKYGRLGVDPTPGERCENTKQRLEAMGYPRSLADKPLASFGLRGFGTGPTAGQAESLRDVADILGLGSSYDIGPVWSTTGVVSPPPVDPVPGPPPAVAEASPLRTLVAGGLLAWGAFELYRIGK